MTIRRVTIIFMICVLAFAVYANAEYSPAPVAAQLVAAER